MATTASGWLDLVVRWQRALDLVAEVSPKGDRYPIAPDRLETYAANRATALGTCIE